jgi:hypothetical protein
MPLNCNFDPWRAGGCGLADKCRNAPSIELSHGLYVRRDSRTSTAEVAHTPVNLPGPALFASTNYVIVLLNVRFLRTTALTHLACTAGNRLHCARAGQQRRPGGSQPSVRRAGSRLLAVRHGASCHPDCALGPTGPGQSVCRRSRFGAGVGAAPSTVLLQALLPSSAC